MHSDTRFTMKDSGAIGRIAPAATRASICRFSAPKTRGRMSSGVRPCVIAAISCCARSGWCATSPMM